MVRPLTTNFKKTVRADWAVSSLSPPPSIYKSSCPQIVRGQLVSGQASAPPPTSTVAGVENKANLSFHSPGFFIDFWVVSSWTPHSFGNRIIWYLLFNVRFFSPSMFLRSSRVPACHRKACSFELQSPAPESVFAIPWRRTVRFLTLTDKVAMDIHVQLCLWPYIFIYLV